MCDCVFMSHPEKHSCITFMHAHDLIHNTPTHVLILTHFSCYTITGLTFRNCV